MSVIHAAELLIEKIKTDYKDDIALVVIMGPYIYGGVVIAEAPTIKQPLLEKMSDFFTARVVGYDEHMHNNVEGCKEGYIRMARRLYI